jgi:NAD(P)-dependent dehydrogenase (short-subunit alcohol dehydrogenase family)
MDILMNYNLKEKVALVTGSAQGIGKATAIAFAQSGSNVILCDINYDKLVTVAKEIEELGVKVLPIKMDVSSTADIDNAIAKGIETFGHIDVLLNCAGICIASKIVELDEKIWDLIMNVNLRGVFILTKKVAKYMIDNGIKGRILTISSQASKIGEYANGAYSCSKSAINTFTQVIAQELAEYGITANCICPGYVNTDIMQKVFEERGPLEGMTPAEYEAKLCGRIPLGRMAEPSEIGNFLAFLASEDANYITGMALTIAGGSTII